MSENTSNATHGSLTGDTHRVDAVEAAVGDVFSPDGRTTVRVERDGHFVVVHEWIDERTPGAPENAEQQGKEGDEHERDQREEHRGDVRELDVEPERLFETVGSLPISDDFPTRPGLPDEPILTLTIESAAGSRTGRMWLRDAEQRFDELVDPLRTIVERATDGRRYL